MRKGYKIEHDISEGDKQIIVYNFFGHNMVSNVSFSGNYKNTLICAIGRWRIKKVL